MMPAEQILQAATDAVSLRRVLATTGIALLAFWLRPSNVRLWWLSWTAVHHKDADVRARAERLLRPDTTGEPPAQ